MATYNDWISGEEVYNCRMDEAPREISVEGKSPPLPQTPPSEKEERGPWFLRRDVKIGAGVLLALGVACTLIFSTFSLKRGTPQGVAEETYTLVRDKISKSSAIVLALPKGFALTPLEATEKVTFEPALKGSWAVGSVPSELLFEPSERLVQGNYYTVSLQTAEGTLSKDFLVDEDPRVLAIFPREKSEAPENSDITIVFNRPMVPLTTLDALDERAIPIEITPATKGKWKWISTRNLQFIPETRLVRSASYKVSIKDGLTSVDGLPVKGVTHTFTTRPIRFEKDVQVDYDNVIYNQPVTVRFNQPVDIERTKGQISVKTTDGRDIPFIAEYGKRVLYEDGKETEYIDKSVLAIYGASDRNGRPRFWDFNTAYSVVLKTVYPAQGDIVLTEGRSYSLHVYEVIHEEMTAESLRSEKVTADLFDPKGKLIVTFFEEINKSATVINAPHLKSVEYGEKCTVDEYGNQSYSVGVCDKEADKTKLMLSFDADAFGNGEEIPVQFKKVVNTEGVSLLVEPLTRMAKTFPKLVIRKTSPENGTKNATLTELKICSNTPLKMPEEKEFYTKVKSSITVGRWNWTESHRLPQPDPSNPCLFGEFESVLRYGLVPESDYRISLELQDDFGQVAKKELTFLSGKIDQMYRRFTAMQKAYNVTSPDRTKLVYGVENLEYVNLHICKVDAPRMIYYLSTAGAPVASQSGESLFCTQAWTKRIELPKRYFSVNFFELNLSDYVPHPLGHYVLSFSHPDYRTEVFDWSTRTRTFGNQAYERSLLTVTNLAVQEKKLESEYYPTDALPPLTTKVQSESKGNLYWVSKFGTLAPVVGARVDVYQETKWASSGTTDAQGIARTPVVFQATAAVVTAGADSAIVSSALDKFQWAQSVVSAQRTYLYTDRPIYRPSETVFIKGLYRIGFDGEYEIASERKANVAIYDSRGELVKTLDVDLSENGTFTGKLDLPKGATLGTYRIEGLGGYGYFEVEEYVPSAFKVEIVSSKEEYVAGDKMELAVDAAYYFGVPLEKGDKVEYSMFAQDYYFDRYSDGYFQFGKGWYYGGYGGYGDRFLLRGRAELNEKGKVTIEQPLDFRELFKDMKQNEGGADRSKIVTVNITVKNKQGQTVSANKSIIVHRGAFYLGSNLLNRYFGKGEESKILLKSVDTQGKGVGVFGIEATIYKITWESYKRQEVDGRFYYRSEEKREAVQTFKMRTSGSGDAEAPFSVKEAGQYQLEVIAKDSRGNPITSQLDFYVYGEGVVSVRPNNNETLELAVDKNTLKVGDTANVVIKSPFESGKALITIERGRIFDYKIIDVTQNLINIPVTIEERFAPNVFFSVLLLSPRPEVKYGQVEFKISTAEKKLTIDVHSDKKNYLPGEKVRLSVSTKDANGKPVSAEVSLAVADMSVLALKGNPKKDPVSFFFNGFPLGVATASNVKNILFEAEVPKGTKGGGGGDGNLASKKRGDFRSTAFWQGVVMTDGAGVAEVTFTLPDNLTTWQSEAVGITKDTKVGVGYFELIARKEVMVTPLKPRFIVPGDTFKLGAKVFNQSDRAIRFNIKLESTTLELSGAKNAFERIQPGESTAVYFDAKAPEGREEGSHLFTISAEGDGLVDIVEDRIAITRNDTYESVATAFSTMKERAKEYVFLPENVVATKGALTITANSTLTLYLSGALSYLIEFPYGCSEQIASRLSAIAITKRGFEAKGKLEAFRATTIENNGQSYHPDELIDIGLSRIYSNQTPDGGFTYFVEGKPNFYLTLRVLETLLDLKKAGYSVQQDVLLRAVTYVTNGALYDDTIRKDNDTVIFAAYVLERAGSMLGSGNPLSGRVLTIANTRKFVRETGSNLSLGYLALILSGNAYSPALRDEVLTTLENRLTVDSRGAFIKTGDRRVVYDYYETPIKNTALLLRAWVASRKDHELTDKVLRWLLKSRAKDGSWGSTNNTLSAVEALTEYTEWKRESNSNFELSVGLDGTEQSKTTFSSANQDSTTKLVIPVSAITKGVMHTIDFVKKNLNTLPNTFYYDLSLTYFLPINAIPARDEGFAITRSFYALHDLTLASPLTEAKVGDVVKGVLTITVPKERRFVSVEDFIPAGMELVNFNLSTEDQSLQGENVSPYGRPRGQAKGRNLASVLGIGGPVELSDEVYSGTEQTKEKLYSDADEKHDDRLFLFREWLPEGVYEYQYYVRALVPGLFHHLPAVVSEMYSPENFGRTRGEYFTVTK